MACEGGDGGVHLFLKSGSGGYSHKNSLCSGFQNLAKNYWEHVVLGARQKGEAAESTDVLVKSQRVMLSDEQISPALLRLS